MLYLTMPTYSRVVLVRNDNIQEFDTRWDVFFLFMEQLPLDDILESLYKVRIREPEKLKTVLEFFNLEVPQNKAKPDYQRLKTMANENKEF